MSFLQGILGGKKNNGPTVASGLSLQSSVYGNPVSIVYGTTRVAPNLIWYGDFVATPVSAGKGGKGSVVGGGGKSGGGQYQYQVAVCMALCEGPIQGIGFVYVDKSVTSLSTLGFSLFNGTYPQAPWSFLVQAGNVISESHTIPSSGPYTITAGQSVLQNSNVTKSGINVFTPASGGVPASGEYFLNLVYNGADYIFNAADAGRSVTISYSDGVDGVVHVPTTIPASSPYTVSLVFNPVLFTDLGVVAAPVIFAEVSGTPGPEQYSLSGSTYTFNAADAGTSIILNYYTFNANSQALGYNGIAYVANSAYQLGQSAALPNHNFEVIGVYANSVSEGVLGESDTISSVPYTNAFGVPCGAGQITVQYNSWFVSDKGVTDIQGNAFTPVASNPGYYEYTVSAGVYTFASSNYGYLVNISYVSSNVPDADPSLVVADLLTNPHYGAAFPSQYLGDLSSYQAYCIASGLLVSMALNQQVQASQPLQDLATATNSAWVWSNGTLKLIPYGDETITQFGYTYTAPSAPVTSLDDDSFMKNSAPIGASSSTMNENPVIMTRKRPADQINSIKLQCLDRANDYNTAVIEAKDQALIEQFKLRQSPAASTALFCNIGAAKQSAQLQLQRQYIRNIYSFQLDQRYIFLDPMDIVSITDTTMGLVDQWVRILEITENDDYSLSISAEEYLQGTGTAPLINLQPNAGFAANYNQDPGDVNVPVIFEPTDALAKELAVWIGVSGIKTAVWGGCDVYISTDGNSYTNIGRIKGPSRQGVLTAILPSVTQYSTGQIIDNTNTLGVDLSESNGQLLSGSQADALNLNTLCYVDGEYLAYENANLVDTNTYDLSFLVRGVYNSTIGSHLAGSQFLRLDNSIFEFGYAAPLIGSTVLIKFVSFNIWGGGIQQLSDVQAFTYLVKGTAYTSPLPDVTGFATFFTGYVAGTTQLIWNPVSDFRQVDYEVRQGPTWNDGNVVYRTGITQGPIQGDGTYWVAAHFQVPNGGPDIYSANPTTLTITGSQITQNVIATEDQEATGWLGTFTNTLLTPYGLQLGAAGNILTDPDYLNTSDILYYGGVIASGTYEIPTAQRVNIGRVAPCQVLMTLVDEKGYNLDSVNVLDTPDYLNAQNILGLDLGNNTDAVAQLRLSQDGTTWGPWQNWAPGTYSAKAFDARVLLETDNPQILATLANFIFAVDVPDFVQQGIDVAISAGGTSIVYPSVFNGGPNSGSLPNLQVTILSASQGDTVVISAQSLSGFTVQVLNGGVGVARNINYVSQGY